MSNKQSGGTKGQSGGSELNGHFADRDQAYDPDINEVLEGFKENGDDAAELNAWLRGEGSKPSSMADYYVKELDEAFSSYDLTEGTFYRGMNLSDAKFKEFANMKAGDRWVMKGFGSTSANKSIAEGFTYNDWQGKNRVMLKIHSRYGLPMEDFNSGESFGSEQEYLLQHNSRYTVKSKKKVKGVTVITMEYVPDNVKWT